MKLFEVAILLKPTKKEREDGSIGSVILNPTSILSTDEQSAAISAVMDNASKLADVDRARMEVLVRPFA